VTAGKPSPAPFAPLKSIAGQFCFPTAAIAESVRARIAAAGYQTSPVCGAGNGWHTFGANVCKEFGARVAVAVLSPSDLIATFGAVRAAALEWRCRRAFT